MKWGEKWMLIILGGAALYSKMSNVVP